MGVGLVQPPQIGLGLIGQSGMGDELTDVHLGEGQPRVEPGDDLVLDRSLVALRERGFEDAWLPAVPERLSMLDECPHLIGLDDLPRRLVGGQDSGHSVELAGIGPVLQPISAHHGWL